MGGPGIDGGMGPGVEDWGFIQGVMTFCPGGLGNCGPGMECEDDGMYCWPSGGL